MPLGTIQTPESAVFNLTTLTPLYTGGIGQHGEQLHPSGLLGSIRHWSGLVARALGDRAFEERVWGKAGATQKDTHAKQVAVNWDGSGLGLKKLPEKIQINNNRGWFFNQGLSGKCKLALTRRGISDSDWHILLLALRIQIRHGTLGARDQFGLGVVGCDRLPEVAPLAANATPRPELTDTLWHTAFFNAKFTKFRRDLDNDPIQIAEGLKLGLVVRYALRNSLRGESADTLKMKELRHAMLGSLNEWGSATNVSAAYQQANNPSAEVRIAVQLKPNEADSRTQVMKAFNQTLKQIEDDGWRAGEPVYEWGGSIGSSDKHKFKNIAEWVNHLAGV